MNILDRYLAKHLFLMVVIVALTLLGVDTFFMLINEMRTIGRGDYTWSTALIFILFTVPRRLYEFFPWSGLIGTMLALGGLAKTSELLIMQSAGYSKRQIANSVLVSSLLIVVMAFCLGEFIAPKAERLAEAKKWLAISQGQTLYMQDGTWVRNDNEFIHIAKVMPSDELLDLTIYKLDNNLQVRTILRADSAVPVADGWELRGVVGTDIGDAATAKLEHNSMLVTKLVDKEMLAASGVKHLERLSLTKLWRVIKVRLKNDLNAREYELAFWAKLCQPFTILVMVYLAMPFIFGPLRSSSMGIRLIIGIIVSLIFYFINSIFAPLVTVTNLPPPLAAFLPTMAFFLISLTAMWKISRT